MRKWGETVQLLQHSAESITLICVNSFQLAIFLLELICKINDMHTYQWVIVMSNVFCISQPKYLKDKKILGMCHWSFHPYLQLSIIMFHVVESCCLLPQKQVVGWTKSTKKNSQKTAGLKPALKKHDPLRVEKVEKFPVLSSLIAEVTMTHVLQEHIKSNLINWSTWSLLQRKTFHQQKWNSIQYNFFIWIMLVYFCFDDPSCKGIVHHGFVILMPKGLNFRDNSLTFG